MSVTAARLGRARGRGSSATAGSSSAATPPGSAARRRPSTARCAHPGDAAAQTRAGAGRSSREALERAGFTLADVVRTRMFVTDISRWEEIGRAHGEVFGDVRPATHDGAGRRPDRPGDAGRDRGRRRPRGAAA